MLTVNKRVPRVYDSKGNVVTNYRGKAVAAMISHAIVSDDGRIDYTKSYNSYALSQGDGVVSYSRYRQLLQYFGLSPKKETLDLLDRGVSYRQAYIFEKDMPFHYF